MSMLLRLLYKILKALSTKNRQLLISIQYSSRQALCADFHKRRQVILVARKVNLRLPSLHAAAASITLSLSTFMPEVII